MLKIAARAVECGQFPFLDLRLPRKVPLPGVDMRVRQPRLRRGGQAIWNKGSMITREMANNRAITAGRLPRQRKRIFGKLFGMRYIKRGRQCRLFTDLIRSQYLGELDNIRRTPVNVRHSDRAVACPEVDAKTELMIHENAHVANDDYLDPEICAAGFAVTPY